jgi:serine/threonine-protein kinase
LLTLDGTPKVTDFGLAKRLEPSAGGGSVEPLTRTGEVLGTPSYMAPEQATGARNLIGPATDVYALGAVLYQLLTGQPPFDGDNPMETMLRVVEGDPVPPQVLQPRVPRDLQTICLKCLDKLPQRRYPTAAALADDLAAFLAGEPIRARPIGRRDRLVRWLRRRPGLALAGGLILLAGLGLLAGAFFFSAAAVGLVAAASALAAGGWYGARLRLALHQVREQRLELERTVERLHLLLETTERLMQADELDGLLRLLSEATTQLVNAERATVYLLDKDRGELWSQVALGENVGEIRVSLGSGIAGTVAHTGEVINIPDPYADPRFNPDIDRRTGYRTVNLLTLPMCAADGHILGVFQILNKRTGSFDAADVELLQSLSRCAAAVVEKALGKRSTRKTVSVQQ